MTEIFQQKLLRRLASCHGLEKIALAGLSINRKTCELPPYRPVGNFPETVQRATPDQPIFITSRFRSGSTLLWQAFHRLPGYTAYYEPLNERRWFNEEKRGSQVDPTHRGVRNYAANYEGLEQLEWHFKDEWTYKHIALGEHGKDEGLVAYIKALLSAASERPVLQFNRIDFRLPFLRRHFPEAIIVHLYRSPRDSWLSSLKGVPNNQDWTLSSFEEHNHFYLLPWYRDLMIDFPWMCRSGPHTHPYFAHYMIWRLSCLFAYEWAAVHISYEELCKSFEPTVARLLGLLGVDLPSTVSLDGMMSARPYDYDHSEDDAFYTAQEARVETLLQRHLPGA